MLQELCMMALGSVALAQFVLLGIYDRRLREARMRLAKVKRHCDRTGGCLLKQWHYKEE